MFEKIKKVSATPKKYFIRDSFRKNETIAQEDLYPFIRKVILKLEVLKTNDTLFTDDDIKIFEKAGNELSTLAIEFPGKYLSSLQKLRWIIDGTERNRKTFFELQEELHFALPKLNTNPTKSSSPVNEINQLLLKELSLYDR